MSKGFNIILLISLAVIVSVYILLYTPVYDILWGSKPPASVALVPKTPLEPKIFPSKLPTKEAEEAKEDLSAKASASAGIKEKPETLKVEKTKPFMVLRDPFEVKFAYEKIEKTEEEKKVIKKKSLYLQGIFIEGKNKYAIIDDKLVHEGDRTSLNYKVYRILFDRVIVLKGKQRKVLKIELGVE